MVMDDQAEGTSHKGEKPEPAANLTPVIALPFVSKKLLSEQKAGLLHV
jgi:hypothetical protein